MTLALSTVGITEHVGRGERKKRLYHFVQNVCISQNKKSNQINQAHEASQLTTSMEQKVSS